MRFALGWLALVVACGPQVEVDAEESDDATSGPGSGPVTTATSNTGVPPVTTSPPDDTTTNATEFTTTEPSTGLDTTAGFIRDPDYVCSVDPTDGSFAVCIECTIWGQDCPRGDKCMPWANDGGNVWNSTRCTPVDPMPDQPGDPCTVEGSGVSGVDSCDIATMCWHVDPKTNEGTCVAFCMGTPDMPVCDDPMTTCFIAEESEMAVCVPPCDPLLPTCAAGEGCWPDDATTWACIPEGSGIDVMDQTSPLCAAGSLDVDATLVASCDPDEDLCCTPLCDASAPDCAPELACTPFYEAGQAPMGLEDLGICLDP